MSSLRKLARSTLLGRLLLIPWRLRNALVVTLPPVGRAIRWAFGSREHYNFTYELSERNKDYLAAFLAVTTRSDWDKARAALAAMGKFSTPFHWMILVHGQPVELTW